MFAFLKTMFRDEEFKVELEYGHILGHHIGSTTWIDEFVVYPKFRGKGFARRLAMHLPEKCRLCAQPYHHMNEQGLDSNQLIRFYESLGFCLVNKSNPDDTVMKR